MNTSYTCTLRAGDIQTPRHFKHLFWHNLNCNQHGGQKEVSLKWLNVPCLSHRPNLALKVCNVTTQAQTLQRGKLIVLSSLWLWLCLREAPFYTQVFSARLLGLYTVGNSDLLKQNFVCLQLIIRVRRLSSGSNLERNLSLIYNPGCWWIALKCASD